MARKKIQRESNTAVSLVRGTILYLCLISLFGSVIMIVQAGMKEKRIRYQLTDQIRIKRQLLEEIRKVDNEIAFLESYDRISGLLSQNLPQLGPPRHPAIEIPVDGLTESTMSTQKIAVVVEDQNWFSRFRKGWRENEKKLQDFLRGLVE